MGCVWIKADILLEKPNYHFEMQFFIYPWTFASSNIMVMRKIHKSLKIDYEEMCCLRPPTHVVIHILIIYGDEYYQFFYGKRKLTWLLKGNKSTSPLFCDLITCRSLAHFKLFPVGSAVQLPRFPWDNSLSPMPHSANRYTIPPCPKWFYVDVFNTLFLVS